MRWEARSSRRARGTDEVWQPACPGCWRYDDFLLEKVGYVATICLLCSAKRFVFVLNSLIMGTKRFKKRWIVLFSVMAVISVAGLFAPVRYDFCAYDDAGIVVFLWRHCSGQECHLYHASELHSDGRGERDMGSVWFWLGLWR